ncbi:tRNA pseudouridine synthase A [Chitinispirillum alkaliphilum]|nr:tRNA pseudouridine synthase A [Chitinispirillum alkaliphilum]
MRCFFRVEYDGSKYGGWQIQKNSPSIQQQLENAFSVVARLPCSVTGAGRTDAGVHARGQGAHIDLPEGADLFKWEASVNGLLPKDIAVYSLREVKGDFHARFSAKEREYTYCITQRKSPLYRNHSWFVYYPVVWEKVIFNLSFLHGSHDFAAFCASGSSTDNTVCNIISANLDKDGELWKLTIKADRFIYKMVRSLVGTLIDIGRGQIKETIDNVIRLKERSLVGQTAPACGLFLEWVAYNSEDLR